MRLTELVDRSHRIAATSSRREKIALLAHLLRRLEPREVGPAVAFLSGSLPAGRIGVGGTAMRAARAAARPAAGATLELVTVAEALERIGAARGHGARAERGRLLEALYERATEDEQGFLTRLFAGELRQGALGGVMEEAVAAAAELDLAAVRRALTLAGDLGEVAIAALGEGRSGGSVPNPVEKESGVTSC